MIRPRGGDFLYTKDEFEIMKSDIELCKQTGCDGIVTGILKKDGSIDKERTQQLVEYAYPLGVTFHRAFDNVEDPLQALEDVIATGSERILTSGKKINAIDGLPLIKQLIEKAEDNIIIMPGSGIKADNIIPIAKSTGAVEFHSSASIKAESRMEYYNTDLDRMDYIMVNKEEVTLMVFELSKISNKNT
jgi:copper homeostasis protein